MKYDSFTLSKAHDNESINERRMMLEKWSETAVVGCANASGCDQLFAEVEPNHILSALIFPTSLWSFVSARTAREQKSCEVISYCVRSETSNDKWVLDNKEEEHFSGGEIHLIRYEKTKKSLLIPLFYRRGATRRKLIIFFHLISSMKLKLVCSHGVVLFV